MLGVLKQPLADARWLGTPATAVGTTAAAYLAALRSVAHIAPGTRLAKDDVDIRVFERWLSSKRDLDSMLVVDEELIGQMDHEMATGTFVRRNGQPFRSLAKQVASGVRSLHHRALKAGHSAITRPLVDDRTLPRYRRYLQLTAVTQEAMSWFETAGMRPGKAGASGTTLTVASRALGISEAFWLLSQLNVDGLEKITPDMIAGLIPTTGADDPGYRRVIRAINGVSAVFKTCVAKGYLPTNPTTGVAHCKFTNHQQRDFLPPEELVKARDLSTLEKTNDLHVVDRLALLLFLDTALRRGELASLAKNQVTRLDGGFVIRLSPGNQKMSGKTAVELHVLYPETTELLDLYVTRIRPRLAKPNAEGFLVDGRGNSASACALVAACAREGERLGLKTYYGRDVPSPHDLRRAFAMCNAAPLGLNLHPHELAERLRDSIEVVFNHYVTSNPLINAQRAKVYQKRAGSVFDEDKARDMMQTLKSWRVDAKLVRKLEREIVRLHVAGEPTAIQDGEAGEWIDEEQCYALLAERWGEAPFWKKFRRYMRQRHAMRRATRFGRVVFKADVTRALADDYVSVRMLKAKAVVDCARLAEVLGGEHGLVMGRLTLIRKEEAWNLLRLGGVREVTSSIPASVQTSPANRSKHPASRRPTTGEKVA